VYFSDGKVQLKTGTDFSWGNRTLILDTTYVEDELIGGVAMYFTSGDTFKARLIKDNYGSAINVWGDTIGPLNNKARACAILQGSDGLYKFYGPIAGHADTSDIQVFDVGTTGSTAHPLAGEISIGVNGKHAAPSAAAYGKEMSFSIPTTPKKQLRLVDV